MYVGVKITTRSTRDSESDGPISIVESVCAALIYADLFDYPLTADEIARYQVGTFFGLNEIKHALATNSKLLSAVQNDAGLYFMRNLETLSAVRRSRELRSRVLWRRAHIYSRIAAHLPYVRMVSVTGALAVDNIGDRPDIDIMVVARHGRVWLCRRGLILLVRLARLFGDELCPNYIISSTNLALDQQDFFTAHELAQMVPLVGIDVYNRLLNANKWARTYLPAGFGRPDVQAIRPKRNILMRCGERLLAARTFDHWEQWELARLRRRLALEIGAASEVVCSPEQCKGHTGHHREAVTASYKARLVAAGLDRVVTYLEVLGAARNAP